MSAPRGSSAAVLFLGGGGGEGSNGEGLVSGCCLLCFTASDTSNGASKGLMFVVVMAVVGEGEGEGEGWGGRW